LEMKQPGYEWGKVEIRKYEN